MEGQRERARASSAFETKKAAGFTFSGDADRAKLESLPDAFEGYATTDVADAAIVAIFTADRTQARALAAGEQGFVVLDRTPFYVESGGQVSDTGWLMVNGASVAEVTGMGRLVPGGPRVHRVTAKAALETGSTVTAVVDAPLRDATRRNHTATHLLHAALRRTLGQHVRQAGSLVGPERLRFDFTHGGALTEDERLQIERLVNEQVYRNSTVDTQVRSTDDAIKDGAMALFGEKYGDRVRVVSVPGFSTELCGGTHVRATGDIGPFLIVEEGGVAAGVRRVEALTGAGAVEHVQKQRAALRGTTAALGVSGDQAADAIARLQQEAKRLARENEQLKQKLALGGGSRGEDDDTVTIGDAKLIARRLSGLEKSALRGVADSLRDRIKRGVVVLAAEDDGKVQLVVSVTKDLLDRVKAGQLIKELAPIVGGGGGGRPDFAEAGGKDPSKIDALLAKAKELVQSALS
jgi:alanyl-tRNA synthetase